MKQSERDECAEIGGCRPVRDHEAIINTELLGPEGLKNKLTDLTICVKSKMPWKAAGTIAILLFLAVIGVIVYFSDIRVMASEYAKVRDDVSKNQIAISALQERSTTLLNNQTTTNTLLAKIAHKLDVEESPPK